MTARHARTVVLAAILVALAPGVWVHARQELTPAAVAETHARAGHGDADAQYELGIMYAEGRGVPQNDAVAFAWYRQAAEQGVAEAQFNVGLGAPRSGEQGRGWGADTGEPDRLRVFDDSGHRAGRLRTASTLRPAAIGSDRTGRDGGSLRTGQIWLDRDVALLPSC